MDGADQRLIQQSIRTTTIICFAIAMSVPIYALVGWFVARQDTMIDALPRPLLIGLVAVAAAMLVAAPVVSRRLKAAAAAESSLRGRIEAYRLAIIVSFALREGVAIIGLAITLLGGGLKWCLGFAIVSLLAMWLDWPGPAQWEALARDRSAAPIG